jgi:hypothetical protein
MSTKTSTWLALRNPILQKTLGGDGGSESYIGAHNTAVYLVLHKLGASTARKYYYSSSLWHAALAIGLALLWITHLLNPYLILASAFLFNAGLAFSSPAHSSVIAEMASSEELSS